MNGPFSYRPTRRAILLAAVFALGLGWLAAAPASGTKPPANRSYFMTSLGVEGPADVDSGCLRFTRSRVCLSTYDYPELCGTWRTTDDGPEERGFSFEIEWEASGIRLRLDGDARVEDRGVGSSLGGSGWLGAEELELHSNWSFAGRQTRRRECRRLALEFKEVAHLWTANQCLKRASFGDPGSSEYVLPYRVGEAYPIGQSYCTAAGSHRASFAYDIDMPVGTPIVAVRDGVVWLAIDEFPDGDAEDEHSNDLWIEHADGSVVNFAHLQHGSFLVEPGDRVVAGQTVAASGDTGAGIPHLHIEVFGSRDAAESNSLPLNFRNARGPLDERGGLLVGETYEALPH